ncbi:MAG: dolichol kinase [Halodesulfurarchaeum sp.]
MSEFGRRLVHVSGTVVPVLYLVDVLAWDHVRYLLLSATVVGTALEVLRLRGVIDWDVYGRFTRDYEQDRIAGYALAIVGATVTAWIFGPRVAVPALMMLTIGDPVSGVLSRDSLEIKQVYVLMATFGVCLAIASLLFVPFWSAASGALAATLADGVKPTIAGRVIDDNLSIPIASAVAMQAVLLVT